MSDSFSRYRATAPVPNPTVSFWQQNQENQMKNFTSKTFPSTVDIVIIGSGLTGALVAYNLLSRPGPKPTVLMLEARSAASGATGRNGGHIKPDVYNGFEEYRRVHGDATAIKQCHFERANLRDTVRFIQENNLSEEVDLVICRTVNIYSTAKSWEAGLAAYHEFKTAGGNVEGITIHDIAEANKLFRIKDCKGAISFDAASLWPYKFAIALISRAVDLGLILHTNTPVTSVTKNDIEGWALSTSTQQVLQAKTVIHTTNGYASHLLPEFSGRVIPLKGHVAAIKPTKLYTDQPLSHTGAVHSDLDFEYLIQRPNLGQHIIVGGGDIANVEDMRDPIGKSDDSTLEESVADYLRTFPARRFEGWAEEKSSRSEAEEPTLVWSGIMGLSKDMLPFVGELPGKKGQFIAAGFHGHGMARIFLTAKNLCRIIHGEAPDDEIPEAYFDLERRMQEGFKLEDMGINVPVEKCVTVDSKI